MFRNELEERVEKIINPFTTQENYTFQTNESFFIYKKIYPFLIKKGGVRLLKNVPKGYGRHTHTEFVLLLNDGTLWRIDCKNQDNQGSNITIDNIRGEIERNTIDVKLLEDKLIFVVDGDGIDWKYLIKYRKKLSSEVLILSVKEFTKLLKQTIIN